MITEDRVFRAVTPVAARFLDEAFRKDELLNPERIAALTIAEISETFSLGEYEGPVVVRLVAWLAAEVERLRRR